MKKIAIASIVLVMASCNSGANDGKLGTDTTNFTNPSDSPSTNLYGDTSLNLDSSTSTNTISKPVTNPGVGSAADDTMKNKK